MAAYRKKPVVIDAFCLKMWGNDRAGASWFDPAESDISDDGIVIHTLEGDHLARWGDWIVRGVEGEIYPVKPSVFAVTYEPA